MITPVGEPAFGGVLVVAGSPGVALVPVGMALVGPVADAIGITETLWTALGVMWACWVGILALPSVWAIRRNDPLPAASPA